MTYSTSSTTTTTITMSAMVMGRRSFRNFFSMFESGAWNVTASTAPTLDTLGHPASELAVVQFAVEAHVAGGEAVHREAVGPLGAGLAQAFGVLVVAQDGDQRRRQRSGLVGRDEQGVAVGAGHVP